MTEPAKKVLIASSSQDLENWQPIVKKLRKKGLETFVFQADKVASGVHNIELRLNQCTGEFDFYYQGLLVDLKSFVAAWFRRPNMFEIIEDKALKMYLDREKVKIQYSLWSQVPELHWLNSPAKMYHADHKLEQLIIAKKVGFNCPETLISNNWQLINKSLPQNIICKPVYSGIIYDKNKAKIVYTNHLKNDLSLLPQNSNPYPSLWQSRVNKCREWRITVVGDVVFSAAIYTNEDAKDDWRKHQFSKQKVQFKQGNFPIKEQEKCLKFLQEFGLKFGAFDFIEDETGKITFLECNVNGQYGWLEEHLGLPISDAIVDELVRIADIER